jgi:hypothetical protein
VGKISATLPILNHQKGARELALVQGTGCGLVLVQLAAILVPHAACSAAFLLAWNL